MAVIAAIESLTARIPRVLSLSVALLAMGCAEEEIHFTEIKQPNQSVSAKEWEAFVRIVDDLPDPKLAPLSAVAVPLPQWLDARTLPVHELAAEERRSLEAAWDAAQLARRFARSRGLARLLSREGMTVEQFAGLAITIGAAMRRSRLSEEFPWDDLVRRGERTVAALQRDQRLFSALPIDIRHRVLDDAVWLHRIDRVERLRQVPAENVALVKEHTDWLAKALPEPFRAHPFEDVVDLLAERGLPFVELPETGHDDELEWSPADAIVGIKPIHP